jgi:hypothetical protein
VGHNFLCRRSLGVTRDHLPSLKLTVSHISVAAAASSEPVEESQYEASVLAQGRA